jgi:DNA-binding FrmR family transcriptional regulator
MQAEDQSEIIRRLQSTGGHLEAIIGMLEAGEPCEPILHQLGAVEAALRAAGSRLLACQLRQSQEVIRHSPCAEDRVAEITRLLVLYHLLTRHSDYSEREQHD